MTTPRARGLFEEGSNTCGDPQKAMLEDAEYMLDSLFRLPTLLASDAWDKVVKVPWPTACRPAAT